MRRGYSIVELILVLALMSILLGIALPRFASALDHAAARSASAETIALMATARASAIARAARVTVVLDTSRARLTIVADNDTLQQRPLGDVHGISLSATRDSVTYGPTGRGYGASNTTLVLRRGSAAETVVVSRLGRVRK